MGLKAAVIGCGRMGAFTSEGVRRFAPACWFPLSHAEAVETHPDMALAALCDADGEMLARAAAHYGVAATFRDHRALLSAMTPDLLCIATRTPGRAGIVADAAAAGTRAFHVEKPLCSSVTELRALETLLARPGHYLTLGAVRRHFRIYREAIRLARSGDHGALLEVRVELGRGPLYWTHPHSVDLVLAAHPGVEVAGVAARLDRLESGESPSEILNDPVIDHATIRFADGVAGHIGRGFGADLRLTCERAEIAVENDGHALVLREAVGEDPYPVRREIDFGGHRPPEGTFAAVAQLAACLAGDEAAQAANRIVRRDTLLGQAVLFAMVQSHRESREISPSQLDPNLVIRALSGGRPA